MKPKIEMLRIADIQPADRNARTHSPEQVKQIAASLKRFGWTNPILLDADGKIVAGHGRLAAAREAGMTEAPVIRLPLSGAEARAYALADNRLAEIAGWDQELLAIELGELTALDCDLAPLGWEPDELADLLANEPAPLLGDPDEVPDPLPDAVSKTGDIWLLGAHRLMCGDSTVVTDVDRLLAGACPVLMVADPPYGVEYDASWRAKYNNDGPDSKRAVGKVVNDDRADWSEAWALFPGDVAYVWHADVFSPVVSKSLDACRFEMRALIVWAKQRHTFGRGHYHRQYEPCWYAVRNGGTGHWSGDRTQTTLWKIDNNQNSETGHSTQKPVECMARSIRNHDAPEVYDPFSGSGTTIVAAEQLGRRCYAMEISPQYVDVAIRRWQALTGKTATLEATGGAFNG